MTDTIRIFGIECVARDDRDSRARFYYGQRDNLRVTVCHFDSDVYSVTVEIGDRYSLPAVSVHATAEPSIAACEKAIRDRAAQYATGIFAMLDEVADAAE